jgi:hypothetical protein
MTEPGQKPTQPAPSAHEPTCWNVDLFERVGRYDDGGLKQERAVLGWRATVIGGIK